MKPTIETQLVHLSERFEEISQLLSLPETLSDQNQFKALSKEFAHLEPIVAEYKQYQDLQKNLADLEGMLDDKEMALLAEEELPQVKNNLETLEKTLILSLIPQDPNDARNVYLEIRAGTGGDEAAIFAGDLFRMYSRFLESQGFHLEVMNAHHAEHGGYKEIIAYVSGKNAYKTLKFESGTHRVQRVPVTESQGRIHTSACTVAVLPEADAQEDIQIRPEDIRVDTYRSSGAGGQHVNKTDSAIRITHIPSGLVVECQEERSQHKNREKAMSWLKSRLRNLQETKQKTEEAQTRKLLVGSGDRSERIRTYNFPQGRLTDHRIHLTLYQLDSVMEGDLTPVIEPLQQEYHAHLLEHFDNA